VTLKESRQLFWMIMSKYGQKCPISDVYFKVVYKILATEKE